MNLGNGIVGEPNGIMSYVFCDNNPLSVVDPTGLDPVMTWDPADSKTWNCQPKGYWLSGGPEKGAYKYTGDLQIRDYWPSTGW